MLLRLRQICNHPYLILNAITDDFTVDDLENALQGADDDDDGDGLDGVPFDMREFVRGTQPKASGLRKVLEAARQVKVYGDAEECAICFDVWSEPVMGNCCHGFCRECIESHLTSRAQQGAEGNCPMCSQPLKNSDLKAVPAKEPPRVDDEDEDWLDSCGDFMHSAKTLALRDQIAEWRENHPGIAHCISPLIC
jgi:DNA repair protein RAD5